MRSFKQHSNQMLSGTDSPAIVLQRIQMKQMHLLAMKMAEASNNQIQYHNSREQLHRLKNVPDVWVPMLDKERNVTGRMNESVLLSEVKANITNSAADSNIAGIKGTEADFATPLFLRAVADGAVSRTMRRFGLEWKDMTSKRLREILKKQIFN